MTSCERVNWSRYLQTKLWLISGELNPQGRTVKEYCWPCQLKANYFWSWTRMEKKAFATSVAAYQIRRMCLFAQGMKPHLVGQLQLEPTTQLLVITHCHSPCSICPQHRPNSRIEWGCALNCIFQVLHGDTNLFHPSGNAVLFLVDHFIRKRQY